jgi:integrase
LEIIERGSNPYSMFVYAIRSVLTRDYYLRRLRRFFDFIDLEKERTIEERCNLFADRANTDPNWAFNQIMSFLQFQKERVEKREITGATLRNFVKAIKLFCEMSDIPVPWKKIARGLPKIRRFADDRAPTIEEIRKIAEYPDRRIKAVLFTMASSGIRLGAWDYLRWGNIKPIEIDGKVVAAKIIVYAGDEEEYFTFITSEACSELEKWMTYRSGCGELINEKSWVMRHLWNTKRGHMHGFVTAPKKLKSAGVKRLMEDALWTQGVRTKLELGKKRHEFQADHGFRKWFKTRCELSGMKSINVETLMSHSIGIGDSYYRASETELLDDYLKAIEFLIINHKEKLESEVKKLETDISKIKSVEFQLMVKANEIQIMKEKHEQEIETIREEMNQQFTQIMSMIQQKPVLAYIKPEALKEKTKLKK